MSRGPMRTAVLAANTTSPVSASDNVRGSRAARLAPILPDSNTTALLDFFEAIHSRLPGVIRSALTSFRTLPPLNEKLESTAKVGLACPYSR